MNIRNIFNTLVFGALALGICIAGAKSNGILPPNDLFIDGTTCAMETNNRNITTATITSNATGEPLITATNLTFQENGILQTSNYYETSSERMPVIGLPISKQISNIQAFRGAVNSPAQFEVDPNSGTCSLTRRGTSATRLVFGLNR